MTMKRVLVVFLAISCVLSSCSLFKGKDYSEEEKKIADAKEAAITAINDAKNAAVTDAQESIRSIIACAVEGASEDISSTINDAKNEIQASAEKSVNQTMNERLKVFEGDLAKAHRNGNIAAIIGLASLILAIVFFILMLRRTGRDEVIETVEGSKRIKNLINAAIEDKYDRDVKPYLKQGTNKNVVEAEIRRYMENPSTKQFIASLIANQDKNVKTPQSSNPGQVGDGRGVQEPVNVQPKVELYAKDSPNIELSEVTPSYVIGRSIYRLILASPDAQTAQITVCTDKEDVKNRILQSNNDLLEPVCRVVRKQIERDALSTISVRPGKAERLSSDRWKVTEPISVELS